ncbi:hypothetical protein QH494_22225 [Sphingomonas sp. AR_OL41]|uniref:hypothetical protein n=1 Tax=Sphingomonas sp. AR_OL41 TaxID=3042729 RepID=UPI0024814496|nr:hypothetical protein [Sphingomonas sp. AR_OL41]MDH7974916.1 hypothetical protein [Sphingomonas sp. AR_OL41]
MPLMRHMLAILTIPLSLGALTLPASARPADEAQTLPPQEKKICRSEQVVGSSFPKRTCHTKAEWIQIERTWHSDVDHGRRNDNPVGTSQL